MKFNEKKLNYILSLTSDGRVKSANDDYGYTIKSRVQVPAGVSVVTSTGTLVGPGESFSVGNARVNEQQVSDFEMFRQWVASGKETASAYQILEGVSTSYEDASSEFRESDPEAPFSANQLTPYVVSLSKVLDSLGLFKDKDKFNEDFTKLAYLQRYYEEMVDNSNAGPGRKETIKSGLIKEGFKKYIKNVNKKLVAKLIIEGGAIKIKQRPKEIIQDFTELSPEKREGIISGVLQSGSANDIWSFIKSPVTEMVSGLFRRVSASAAKSLVKELEDRLEDIDNESDRDKLRFGISVISAISPKKHIDSLAEHLGMSPSDFNYVLSNYQQGNVFDSNGFILQDYKKKIDNTDFTLYLLKEKLKYDLVAKGTPEEEADKLAGDLAASVARFSNEGPFALNEYVKAYANTAPNSNARYFIRTSSSSVKSVDEERIKLLTTPLVNGLSVSDILSNDDEFFRRREGRKALDALQEMLEGLPEGASQKTSSVLEKTVEKLREHLDASKVTRVPPVKNIDTDDAFFNALDSYYEMQTYADSVVLTHSPQNSESGILEKNIQRLVFLSDDRLVKEGFIKPRELHSAAGNIAVLGWNGSLIRESFYNQIVEQLSREQRDVLSAIDKIEDLSETEKLSLKHKYLSVVFSNNPGKFPLNFSGAASSLMTSVYNLPENSVIPMDEPQAKLVRGEFDGFMNNVSQEVLQAARTYGENFANLGRKGYSKNDKYVRGLFIDSLNISPDNKSSLNKFLIATKKSSKQSTQAAKIGYYAESAVYASLAASSIPEGGSIDFSKEGEFNILTVRDASGKIAHQFIDHGRHAGMCDMAIVKFGEDGKPLGLLSSELKVYAGSSAQRASFNELLGFSNIIEDLKAKHDMSSIPLAGAQQVNLLRGGSTLQVFSSNGKVNIADNSTGEINSEWKGE